MYPIQTAISRLVWDTRYRYRDGNTLHDQTITDTWRRVAQALATAEAEERKKWEGTFYQLLEYFRFLPGGRILAGAGTNRRVTSFNCFVMGTIEDSLEGIFSALKEGALTMQQGGGVGYDFSTIRPYGCRAKNTDRIASGPVSFMRIWDSMCATLLSTGSRRGAMMATLRCDHPDILDFIDAKRDAQELRHFNLSVLITDAFMQALQNNDDWPLVFPQGMLEKSAVNNEQAIVERHWSGQDKPVSCRVFEVLPARELWQRLTQASYDVAEPGVLFIDRINAMNNLWYCEQICATNPCGEIPLPPYGACDLGSLNLTRFIERPFESESQINFDALLNAVPDAVRLLDNVIDVSGFPLQEQQNNALSTRRIGLGITGLADALLMLGIRYGTQESLDLAAKIMRTITYAAYRSSIQLAEEKGSFPAFDKNLYLQGQFVQTLPEDIRDAIRSRGIRNSHLIAIAPTGTISLLANNISSGIEPVFNAKYRRRLRSVTGSIDEYEVIDYACNSWQNDHGQSSLPPAFVNAYTLTPDIHLKMQAAIQPYVDSAISKTINLTEDFSFSEFQSIYETAYELGLKGCTTFRPNPVTGSILSSGDDPTTANCCNISQQMD